MIIDSQPSYSLPTSPSTPPDQHLYVSKSQEVYLPPEERNCVVPSTRSGVRSISEPSIPNRAFDASPRNPMIGSLCENAEKLSSSPLEFDLKHFENMRVVDNDIEQLQEAGVENPYTFAVITNSENQTESREPKTEKCEGENISGEAEKSCTSTYGAEGNGEEGEDMNTANLLRLSSCGGNAARLKVKEFVESVIDKDNGKKKDSDMPDMNQVN